MLKIIPGFRSGKRYKKIIAVIGYSMSALFFLLIWIATDGTIVDKSIVLFQVLFLLSMPFMLLTNFLGIRRYIPLVNSKNFLKLGIGLVLSFVIWFLLFGVLIYSMDGLHTPEYKAAAAKRQEQRAKEQLAKEQLAKEQRAKEQDTVSKEITEVAKNVQASKSDDSNPRSEPSSTPTSTSSPTLKPTTSSAVTSSSSEKSPDPSVSSPADNSAASKSPTDTPKELPTDTTDNSVSPGPTADTSGSSESSGKAASETQANDDSASAADFNDTESTLQAISGMAAVDIKLNLENWGIPNAKPQKAETYDGVLYESSAIDPDTGVELGYSIMADNRFNVISVTFRVVNLYAISKKDFIAVAGGFLGYCATVPYDTADPQKAKQWVLDNINKTDTAGKVETLIIGDAEFSLYGNGSGVRFLEIKKAK